MQKNTLKCSDMKVSSNFEGGEHRFSIFDLTIEEIDNLMKSLYYAGWYNNNSPDDIVSSIQSTYYDLCRAIETRTHYLNGILTDATAKISEP